MKVFKLFIVCFMVFSVCTNAQSEVEVTSDKKVLIVYLSRTNNTRVVAEIIQQKTLGALVALELVNPYPENYKKHVEQVSEENRVNFLPLLKTKIKHIEKYDFIFIGYPTWGMELPPPFKSFLKQYDLSGKTIIPFNTNAGYGAGNSFNTMRQFCPDCHLVEALILEGGKERDGIGFVMEGAKKAEVTAAIENWLKMLDVL